MTQTPERLKRHTIFVIQIVIHLIEKKKGTYHQLYPGDLIPYDSPRFQTSSYKFCFVDKTKQEDINTQEVEAFTKHMNSVNSCIKFTRESPPRTENYLHAHARAHTCACTHTHTLAQMHTHLFSHSCTHTHTHTHFHSSPTGCLLLYAVILIIPSLDV